ncbi:MAG: S53 family peptidase, partial [Clostridiaceae bacterium]|nr:S53 family peptidase [Clostridiaceae bacterium]
HYPTALVDFNVFSRQFGLPLETSINPLSATNKVLQVVYARGVQPEVDLGWASESCMDIQWAHALAPCAKIVLVEAESSTCIDMFQAVDVGNTVPNVCAVSMSWGGFEWSSEMAFDAHLKQPGVIYVAAAGDNAGLTLYPSASQYVVSVGGTKLNRNKFGKFVSETGWIKGGGGPSIFVPIPSYQAEIPSVAAKCGAYRGTPDVSFDADSAPGLAVYGSTRPGGLSGWFKAGGTSVGAPCWAGIIACITSAGSRFINTAEFMTHLYLAAGCTSYTNPYCCFRDILFGKAGTFSCAKGWDFVTGLGSPNIRNLIILGVEKDKL